MIVLVMLEAHTWASRGPGGSKMSFVCSNVYLDLKN